MRLDGAKLSFLLMVFLLSGCAVGYNSAVFVARSNVGLDVETTPPIAEISISRQEGVIAPVFEYGRTPPLLSGFGTESEGLLRIPFGGRSVFAGGGAAVALSWNSGATLTDEDIHKRSMLCLSQEPKPQILAECVDASIPGPGQYRPMVLVSDTAFGVKAAWSGATSTVPSSLTVGYNRKEMVVAPVLGSNKVEGAAYGVWLPSFLAVLDTRFGVGPITDSTFSYNQIIATGQSATDLGCNPGLRTAVQGMAAGKAVKPEAQPTPPPAPNVSLNPPGETPGALPGQP